MRYPEFIHTGSKIGLVAPSFGCSENPYLACMESATDELTSRGYKIEEGPNARRNDGIGISSTPKNCGQELTDFYCDDRFDALIACGGGELMCETLDYVDFFECNDTKPKWYMGYSDNTNFTFLLNTMCDTASIYGPSIGAFGAKPMHKCQQDALDLLTGVKLSVSGYDMFERESLKNVDNPLAPYNLTEKKVLRLFKGENEVDSLPEIHGRLLGGCLDCLANLVGTEYDKVEFFNQQYATNGIIWFLEACDLNPMSIRRALWQLDRAGWFEQTVGFIIGRPLASFGVEQMGLDQYTAVTGILGDYNVPIIMDADLGHLPPAMPLISGAMADVKVVNGNITVNHILQ